MTILQTNPDALGTFIEQLIQWPQIIGLAVLALAVWLVYRRTQDDADPAQGVVIESDTGAATINISGAYYIGLLVVVVAALTWPLPLEYPLFGVAHLGLVGVAWWLEKREAMD